MCKKRVGFLARLCHQPVTSFGEGNGNPLQCSCLENPRDRGAWWAAVYGVAQSWTRLKRLSSSSSSYDFTADDSLHLNWIFFFYGKWIFLRNSYTQASDLLPSAADLTTTNVHPFPWLRPLSYLTWELSEPLTCQSFQSRLLVL